MRNFSDGDIGEIWLNGPCIARGYWDKPNITDEIFHAHINGDGETNYLRTGDLGCKTDEEVYIFGRRKEMLIIRGQNYYPKDIEAVIAGCHEQITADRTLSFSVDDENGERLVIVHELSRDFRKESSGARCRTFDAKDG